MKTQTFKLLFFLFLLMGSARQRITGQDIMPNLILPPSTVDFDKATDVHLASFKKPSKLISRLDSTMIISFSIGKNAYSTEAIPSPGSSECFCFIEVEGGSYVPVTIGMTIKRKDPTALYTPSMVKQMEETAFATQAGTQQQIAIMRSDRRKQDSVNNRNDSPEDEVFIKIDDEAKFSECACKWTKYLEENLDVTIPKTNGAPAGTYTVIVQFKVHKNGNISEVQAISYPRPSYGMEKEAVRLIMRAPKWIPATYYGRDVASYKRQPITFIVPR